ncbi:MAG: globin-coupled sensor protein [Myxococcota bacterium]
MDQPSLSEIFGIDEANLARRREFVGLDAHDQALLESLIPWAERVAPRIAEQFYDHQFSFSRTRVFFERHAAKRGMTLGQLRRHLESAQADYLIEVFTGARDGWDVAYFERRLKVGAVHDRIDLPYKWYVGSYPTYTRLLNAQLRRSYFWRPGFAARAGESIGKVFNLDQQAIGDAFLLSTFRSMNFDLSTVACEPGADRTEHIGEAKRAVAEMTGALGEHATSMARAAVDLQGVSLGMASSSDETLTKSQSLAAAAVQMEAAIAEIARSAARAATVASAGAEEAAQVRTAITALSQASVEIGEVVKVITTIASRTNLLSLNASIEAVRAGESGKGFQVVAKEVKELAAKTASSTVDIGQRIAAIQSRIDGMQRSVEAIAGTVGQINELQQTIAGAVEEQTNTTREIAMNISDLAGAASRSAEQIGQTNTSASELARRASELGQLTSRFH